MQTLPPLSAEERAHGERLREVIHGEIDANNGWISFERYMELALYAPRLGYYSAGARKFGSGGDFVTAPEISPLFGYCLGAQCAQVLQTLGGGSILELGAGSGVMAADILTELERLECLPERYMILEVSADLRARQREKLQRRVPQLLDRIVWLQTLPDSFQGVLVANEVLDALPVQRFRIHHDEIFTLGVTRTDAGFGWANAPAEPSLEKAVREVERHLGHAFADGYTSEINVRLRPWLAALAATLNRGVMLWIDYGLPRAEYYNAARSQGTLLCHSRHHYLDDPFINVGLQDITAWVDFTATADAGLSSGLDIMGFTTQAHFLLGAGIDRYLQKLDEADVQTRARGSQQVQRLILPGEMGERFKVLGLAKDFDQLLSCFSFRDLRERL